MKHNLFRSIAIIAGAVVAHPSLAVVRDSTTFNVEPALTNNFAAGTLRTHVFTVTGYSLGRIDYIGDITQINFSSTDSLNENKFRVLYPGGTPYADLALEGYFYSGTVTFSGSFFLNAGALAPYGLGTWNFRFINNFDDGTLGQPDSSINITFNLSEPADVTYNPVAQGIVSSTLSYAPGQVRWYTLILPYPTGQNRFLDIDTETSTATLQTAIGIYDYTGTLVTSDFADGSGNLSQLSYGGYVANRAPFSTGGNPFSQVYDGRDGNLPAGNFFLAVAQTPATFNPLWNATSSSPSSTNITLRVNYGVSAGQPISPTDLGVLGSGSVTGTFDNTANEIKWYKFTLSQATGLTRFLDVDLDPLGIDYDLALFDATGTPRFFSDGKAPAFEPFLSFGGQDNTRSALTNTAAFGGHSGTLSAGTYYLVVGHGPLSVATNFVATTTSNYVGYFSPIRFRFGTVVPPSNPLFVHRVSGMNKIPDSSAVFSSVFGIIQSPSQSDRQFADDFVVPAGGWSVNLVEATFTRANDTVDPSAVRVTFFQNGVGPATQLSTQTIPWASILNEQTGLRGTTETLYRMRIPITTASFSPGTYWVSVQPLSTANMFWVASSPDTPVAGSPAYFRRGPSSTGTFDSAAGYPTAWTPTGTTPFTTPSGLAFRLEDRVVQYVTGTINFGNLTPIYNYGPLPSTIEISWRDEDNNHLVNTMATYNSATGSLSAEIPAQITGPYRVSFKLGFWLRRTYPNPNDPAHPLTSWNFGLSTPEVGDADFDNEITNGDYSLWAAGNGNSVSPNTSADFDGDGEITNADYATWAANNGISGDN